MVLIFHREKERKEKMDEEEEERRSRKNDARIEQEKSEIKNLLS
jgi:F0F1-type ATP synthase epsilon subunit